MTFIQKLRCFRHYFWYIHQVLYVNFHYLPFPQAIKLPIWVKLRNGIKRKYHTGTIQILSNDISFGMIELGVMQYDEEAEGMSFLNDGDIIFNGKAHISNGSLIKIVNSGKLVFGDSVGLSTTKIYCARHIIIGNETFCGIGTCIMDSDFHPVIDLYGKCYINTSSPVRIGNYNWIGAYSLIMKGTRTPNHCIVSARSVLNKPYKIPEFSILSTNQGHDVVHEGYIRDRILKDNYVKAHKIDNFDEYINKLI